ncbi:hypothetical protein [Nostoc sp. C052]|nr:hypothetical protein [Nostoc sp. C052]
MSEPFPSFFCYGKANLASSLCIQTLGLVQSFDWRDQAEEAKQT